MNFLVRFFTTLGRIGAAGLLGLLILEALLRLYPAAVPLSILIDFNPTIRESIAKRLALPTESEQVTVARDDGGPRLTIYSPNQIIRSKYIDSGIINEVQMDSRGFCNPRTVYPNQTTFDIVALGDSFTWCTNVHPEDTWPMRLGGLLKAPTYNLGRPRTGLHEYVQLLKAFGLTAKPKLVVLNVYAGNDLRDAIIYFDHTKRGSGGVARDLSSRTLSTAGRVVEWFRTGWLGGSSYAFNLVFTATIQGYEWLRRDVIPRDSKTVRPGLSDFRYTLRFGGQSVEFNPENADVDEAVHARAVADGTIKPDVFDSGLDAIVVLSRERGFKLLITYTPSAYTAYADIVAFRDPSLAPLMIRYSDILRRYFAEATAKRSIDFLDLTPTLQQAARARGARDLLYYPTNVHLTAAGHAVIAEAIARHVQSDKR